jgi:mono/diheme cytochrome c family protein
MAKWHLICLPDRFRIEARPLSPFFQGHDHQTTVTGVTEPCPLESSILQCILVRLLNENPARRWQMTKIATRLFIFAIALAFVLTFSLSAHAQDGAALYKAKCAMCHGADGSKIAAHNLQTAEVQKMSDADLAGVVTNGKPPRMPATKGLKPEEVSAVVTYVRTLKK